MDLGERRAKVLVLGNLRPEGLDLLGTFADPTILPEPVAQADILNVIGEMDAILHKIGRIDAEIMARQTRLRIIARHGVGLDDLDLESIRASGVPVSTTLGANANAVAEATVGHALNALRHLGRGETMIKRERAWARETLMGRELRGATVGIIGYGRIGRLVARYFDVFGARLLVHDAVPEALEDCPHPTVGLEDLLRTADVISLHCPLTAATRHLIDRARLALVKSDSIIVNTSRGGLIDQAALAEAVRSGRIGGAALDVFDHEPPDFDDAIFATEGIVTTPHIAAMTIQAQIAMAVGAAEEIRRVLVDRLPPTNDVLAPAGSGARS